MIDYVDASKFLQDSLDKQIHINSVDGTINITNADIVGESFTLTESICSEENLIFGSCEPSCIKFTVKNTIPKMYRKWFNVTIELQGSSTPFAVGKFRVWGEKPSSDRTTKEITAYDDLYGIFRHTYKRWYKNLWTNTDTMTIKQFRDAWFTRLQQTHSHISQETTTLANDDVIIKKSKKITKPSGKDIFNAICEINGVFGKIGRDGVFHYITLQDNNTTYPIANAQTIEVDYEDYTTTAIDRVEILDCEGDILGYAGESADDAENTYTIENNFMLKGLGNDDSAKSTGDFLAQNIFGILQYVTFIPIDANFKGNPCFETGDRISFAAHGNTITSYILERTMKGIQSLRDNYMSEGDIEYPESVNTYSSKIKELKNDVGSKSTNNVSTANVSSLSDVNNGDTYFKINQSRTIFKKYTASNVAVADLVQNNNGISFNVTTNTGSEHETIIFKLEGLTVGETIQIEWYYRITQWNNSNSGSNVWGVGFSEIYPIHDANGYDVYPLGYPISSGQGVAKTKTYNGKTCYWYSFQYSTSWKSVTWISPKATAKTMYLYFSSDDVTDGQTFKWEVSNLKFTQPVTLVDSEPRKEVDELYVNSDGDWYRFAQSDAARNYVGSSEPISGKEGDFNVITTPPIKIERHINNSPYWYATQLKQNSDGKYDITVTGYSDDAVTPIGSINAAIFKAIGFGGAGTYHIKCKMQFDGYTPNAWGCNNMGLYISYDDSGIYFQGTVAYGTLSTTPVDTFLLNIYNDNAEHEYSFDFIIDNAHASSIVNKTMYITVVMDRCWKYHNSDPVGYASGTLTVKDLEITGANVQPETEILGIEVKIGDKWENIGYVNKVSQTQGTTGGTEIAEIENTNGTKTKIYQKTVNPNPTGTATEVLGKITIGDTIYELGGGNVDDVKVDGTSVVTEKVANINTMTGATSQADGAKGLVPTPTATDNGKFLRGDGTWAGAGAISELTDVNLSNLSDNEILKYNGATQKWINGKLLYYELTDPTDNIGTDGDFWVKYEMVPTGDWTADAEYLITNGGSGYGESVKFVNAGDNSFFKMHTGKAVMIFYVGTTGDKWSGPVLLTKGNNPTYVSYYRGPNYFENTGYTSVTIDDELYLISTPGIWITNTRNTKTTSPTAPNVTDEELGYPTTEAEKAAAIIEKANVQLEYEPHILGMWVKAGGKWQLLIGGDGSAEIYDDTERIVGTWFGETLYQKTVSCGALPNANTKQVSHGISNIGTVVNIFGYTNGGLGTLPLPYSTNNINANIGVNIPGDNTSVINLFTGSDRSNLTNTYVTLQYTKTS